MSKWANWPILKSNKSDTGILVSTPNWNASRKTRIIRDRFFNHRGPRCTQDKMVSRIIMGGCRLRILCSLCLPCVPCGWTNLNHEGEDKVFFSQQRKDGWWRPGPGKAAARLRVFTNPQQQQPIQPIFPLANRPIYSLANYHIPSSAHRFLSRMPTPNFNSR